MINFNEELIITLIYFFNSFNVFLLQIKNKLRIVIFNSLNKNK
jgi:hypothetical protein